MNKHAKKNLKDTRIDKLFSGLGLLSRSECKIAAKKGRIGVNGEICRESDAKCDPNSDIITLDGRIIDTRPLVYYMLNKPSGVITAKDDKWSETVFDLMEDKRTDLAAVGRLDKDTTGLLLITNDGGLNHRMLSPRHHVPKVYRALIDGVLTEEDIKLLEEGVDIGDEKPTLPAEVRILNSENPQLVAITLTEGRYHQVKRMFAAVGKPVLKLHRSQFGPLKLDEGLKEGEYRDLNPEEMALLKELY